MLDNLKKLREEKGMSQAALGAIVKRSQQSIDNYEKGINRPDLRLLVYFAELFDTTTDYLLGLSKDRRRVELSLPDGMSESEVRLLSAFRSATNQQQDAVIRLINSIIEDPDSPINI